MDRTHLMDSNIKEIVYLVMKESIFTVLNTRQPRPNGFVSSLILKNTLNTVIKSNLSVNLLFKPTEVNVHLSFNYLFQVVIINFA